MDIQNKGTEIRIMDRRSIEGILRLYRSELDDLNIRSLSLFGSAVRGEAGKDSVVDFLVEFNRPVGLLHFSRVRLRLEEMLGRPVDLVSRKALIDELKDDILAEAVDVLRAS